jgi:predicted nuclease of restriction endonuclease-like RecB superfamily
MINHGLVEERTMKLKDRSKMPKETKSALSRHDSTYGGWNNSVIEERPWLKEQKYQHKRTRTLMETIEVAE